MANIKQLLSDQPHIVKLMKDGALPLHEAVQCKTSDSAAEVVSTLLTAYPEAALIPANQGNLPLHLAATQQSGEQGFQILKLLIKSAPDTARLKNHQGHTALKCALHRKDAAQAKPLIELLSSYDSSAGRLRCQRSTRVLLFANPCGVFNYFPLLSTASSPSLRLSLLLHPPFLFRQDPAIFYRKCSAEQNKVGC